MFKKMLMSVEEVNSRLSSVESTFLVEFLGYVTVDADRERHHNKYGLFLCSCGERATKQVWNVLSSMTRSCGCMSHGKRKPTSLTDPNKRYRVRRMKQRWRQMIDRCGNPEHDMYKYYGARGISVCERWRESFESFIADMGWPEDEKLTIERINNDGNYTPGNCKWATYTEQNRNKRSRRKMNRSK